MISKEYSTYHNSERVQFVLLTHWCRDNLERNEWVIHDKISPFYTVIEFKTESAYMLYNLMFISNES